MKFLVSPTDSELSRRLKNEAIVSTLPEEKGADVLAYTKRGLLGIQRKEVPHDFILSISDGRLARETSLLKESCDWRLLLCEGRFRYYPDGKLAVDRKEPSSFTRSQIRGILADAKYIKDVDYDFTEDLDDTVSYIRGLTKYMETDKHFALYTRPSAKGNWITPTAKDIELWILQSFPGVGPATADSIVKQFGCVPLRWTCTLGQLCEVSRLSRKRAEYMFNILGHMGKVIQSRNEFDEMRRRLVRDV